MKPRSIGARLTLWYASVTALTLLAFCAGVWFTLDRSLYHAVDESLRDRVDGIRRFIETQSGWLTLEEMQEEFREHSVLGPGGDLFQVADESGQWLYRSDPLYDEHVPVYRAPELGSSLRYENVVVQGTPLRFLAANVDVQGQTYTVQVAAPLRELQEGVQDFWWAALPAIPVVLLAAAAGGHWISKRALHPVDVITNTTRSISADNLSGRLIVPATGDELERLSLTLNEMMERLEASFKRISRFTADASHELRTPLAIMRTTAEVALRSLDDADRKEALEQIVAELERTSHLVDNLLLLSKADSSSAAPVLRPLDMRDAIRDAGTDAANLAQSKDVQLKLLLPEEPVYVNGDASALRRLFLLLLDNGIKYTPAGGTIEVALNAEGDEARASVRDTGIGIPERDLPYIFERFYRVDESRSREQGGAGLGLSIGRWIAEAHGGILSVESAPNCGSVFSLRLRTLRASGDRV